MKSKMRQILVCIICGLYPASFLIAQNPTRPRPPEFKSPEVSADRKITFRIHAPQAQKILLSSSDIPNTGPGLEMTKGEEGVWEVVSPTVLPGYYRYSFQVDGLTVTDPRNPISSETLSGNLSLVNVSGSEIFDVNDVPHGNIASVIYFSKTLNRFRRMHVYTPPGYEKGNGDFPTFYLLHGATDSDASWSTIGAAGIILDNLIASGKSKPMVVVMPAGHTGQFRFGPRRDGSFDRQMDEFREEFNTDIRPHIETNFRVRPNQKDRAIAGLSMGGAQTLNIAWENPENFGYVGVFSSGVFGIAGGFGGEPPNTQWEEKHRAILDNADLRKGQKLCWFACGNDDFLVQTSNATVKMLESHGINVINRKTDGGHTWINWRNYLQEFAPLLFTQ